MKKFYNRLNETRSLSRIQFRKKNGAVFGVRFRLKPLIRRYWEGRHFRLEDITERKRASELLRQHAEDLRVAKKRRQATRSKSEFWPDESRNSDTHERDSWYG